MMSKLEICKLLTVSTGHLTAKTRQLLESHPEMGRGRMLPCYFDKGEYGWFVFVGEPVDPGYFPADLSAVMDYARSQGCEWLCFDCDASLVPGLVWYDDEPVKEAPTLAPVEVSAVLAGLRMLQEVMRLGSMPTRIHDILCAGPVALSPEDIDGLCERLNS
jgi:hypothetical protein